MSLQHTKPKLLKNLFELDSYLKPYENEIVRRYRQFVKLRSEIEAGEGFEEFTTSYLRYGLLKVTGNAVESLEWCPGAKQLYLYGEFNDWNRTSHPFTATDHGKWRIRLNALANNICPIAHNSVVKIIVECADGRQLDRISPWAGYVTPDSNSVYEQRFWDPPVAQVYKALHPHPPHPSSLRIYEAHVGISSSVGEIATYRHFRTSLLPHIKRLGYNAIQFMAIMEHAYYASFGYQVTSFFAPSSRFGSPEELKELVDAAHGLGFTVLLDVVHSHASMNTLDGLNEFNGTNSCFFHDSLRGTHSQWGSRLFNYTSWEVLRFLLSNLRMWIDVYGFDGFRFDGATSMIYHNHGIGDGVSGSYDDYFSLNVDTESMSYLTLANHLLHETYPEFMITIAEEVSGMPAFCRLVEEGGQGFDYRLSMGIPDKWIKLLKHERDEDWSMADICWTLSNRRHAEKHIAYAESHDQALVGDKSLIFWLIDAEMYTGMSALSECSSVVARGIALHKLIRMVTHSLGGEAYLNFIGNEFGHPEWLDFPRKGNGESFLYARRQFNLVENENLRYKHLNCFDAAMNALEQQYNWLRSEQAYISRKHESDKLIVYERASLLFVFNFHPSKSFTDYRVGVEELGDYKLVLSSDDPEFGGYDRLDKLMVYHATSDPYDGRKCSLRVYSPCRTVLVLARL